MGEKDLFTLAETIDYFELSRIKFSDLMKSQKKYDLIVYYRNRKIRTFCQRATRHKKNMC
ncbi:MAG: hypothetical protein Q4D76_18230 [Oscillospiraceae bacterium]|nr:hypothetical protein [Oscillospiraceae bacterium]